MRKFTPHRLRALAQAAAKPLAKAKTKELDTKSQIKTS